MAKINEKPGKNGYKILHGQNTVIMNYKFATAAAEYGTKEYDILKSIHQDFPGMQEVVMSGREKKSASTNARLTYENMETHIQVYENAEELLEVFHSVKALSATVANPYKYVSDWFKSQFPNYKTAPAFQDGKLTVLPKQAPEIKEYKQKMPKAG